MERCLKKNKTELNEGEGSQLSVIDKNFNKTIDENIYKLRKYTHRDTRNKKHQICKIRKKFPWHISKALNIQNE